jgi:hypothetical protein
MYKNTAEAMADGWALVQYNISTDRLTVRAKGGLDVELPADRLQTTICVADMWIPAVKLCG